MEIKTKENYKSAIQIQLDEFASSLEDYLVDSQNQWTIKGFIDIFQNIYTISTDTKIVSKILEIHLFPKFLEFAEKHQYEVVLASHQNWYPDLSFISKVNPDIKFALDLKTTYLIEDNPDYFNGFTLGSHGAYFIDRKSKKNIQFPYDEYIGHYCLGIIYSSTELDNLNETKIHKLSELQSIPSVINNLKIFAREKWTIASDKSGSGNTANIGSIKKISDIVAGNGVFRYLGEEWFDDYWMNYGKISYIDKNGHTKKITSLEKFLEFKGQDTFKNISNTNN